MPTKSKATNLTILDRSGQPSTDVAPYARFTFQKSEYPIEVEYLRSVVLANSEQEIEAYPKKPPELPELPVHMLGSSRAGHSIVVDLRTKLSSQRYAFISEVKPDQSEKEDTATEIIFATDVAHFNIVDILKMVAVLLGSAGRRLSGHLRAFGDRLAGRE